MASSINFRYTDQSQSDFFEENERLGFFQFDSSRWLIIQFRTVIHLFSQSSLVACFDNEFEWLMCIHPSSSELGDISPTSKRVI